jgi:hypothetical protein
MAWDLRVAQWWLTMRGRGPASGVVDVSRNFVRGGMARLDNRRRPGRGYGHAVASQQIQSRGLIA